MSSSRHTVRPAMDDQLSVREKRDGPKRIEQAYRILIDDK